jgi:hypothetical protein
MKTRDLVLKEKNIDSTYYWKLIQPHKIVMKVYNKSTKLKVTPEKKYNKNGELIYDLVGKGKNILQISIELGLNPGTVKYWIKKREIKN